MDRGAYLEVLLRRREPSVGLAFAVVIASLLHLAALPGLDALAGAIGTRVRHTPPRADDALTGSSGSRRRIELELRERPAPAAARPPPASPRDDVSPEGQPVSLPPPQRVEQPKHADYVSEFAQRTERETRARVTSSRDVARTRAPQQGIVAPLATPSTSPQEQARASTSDDNGGVVGDGRAISGSAGTNEHDGGGAPRFAFALPHQSAQTELHAEATTSGTLREQDARQGIDGRGDVVRLSMGASTGEAEGGNGSGVDDGGAGLAGGDGSGQGSPGRIALVPGVLSLQRIVGMPANDWLRDVEEDDATSLNAFEWKHAAYFNRIADALRREWQGGPTLAREDPHGDVFGFEERTTVVEVTIDRGGNVVDLAVSNASGAGPLDDEAVRAFKAAGPFPNPPPGLFVEAERYSFRFGFHVAYQRSRFDLDWKPR